MGQKFKKLKIDVLEIALHQWNERVRRYLANEICLSALSACFAAFNNITTVQGGEQCSGVSTLQATEPPYSVNNGPIK